MKIKAGQCVRTQYGKFYTHDEILENYSMEEFMALHEHYKVADTPQELIEVGDGVKFNRPMYHNDLVDVKKINKHNEGFEDERTDLIFSQTSCDLGEVVAIYTLQGKDYICQWEAE